MENILNTISGNQDWENAMFFYISALKNVETKIDILNSEFKYIHNYEPIEHIKTRLKTPNSIMKKLSKYNHDVSIENMIKYIYDIAGIRIICSFTSDIYRISKMLMQQRDISIVQVKDYIAQPKPNGYKSLHIIVKVPIYMASGIVETMVEIQIRTIAMDFWASLEHKIHYKFDGKAPDNIVGELKECADMISKLDDRMLCLNEKVIEANELREVITDFSSFSN